MARQASVLLNSIEAVKQFVACTNRYPFPIYLVTEKYRIDAKSIMGVFSMDLSHPITVEAVSQTGEADEFFKNIQTFQP